MAVTVDLSALGEASFRRLQGAQLEDRAVVRLVQEGFAVVGAENHPEVKLRVRELAGRLELLAEGSGYRQVLFVPLSSTPRLPVLHLEVAQRLAELARKYRRPPPPPVEVAPVAAVPEPLPSVSVPLAETPSAGAKVAWELGAGGATLLRQGAVDPLVDAEAAVWPSSWGARLTALWTWSPASHVSVNEVALQLGVARRHPLTEWLSLDAGLSLGPWLHLYQFSGGTQSPAESGARVDLVAAVPVTLAFRLTRALSLRVRAAPGFSLVEYQHELDGQLIWNRGHWQLGLTGALFFNF